MHRLALGLVLAATALTSGCVTGPEVAGGPQFLAQNGRRVVPMPEPGVFEVLAKAGDGGPSFFCAAGDFADRRLGARATDRVVLIEPVGDSRSYPGTRGAQFRVMSPAEAPPSSGLFFRMNRAGESRTIGAALQSCNRSGNGINDTW